MKFGLVAHVACLLALLKQTLSLPTSPAFPVNVNKVFGQKLDVFCEGALPLGVVEGAPFDVI